MSELKVNSIKGVGASVAALSINNTDGTCTANITNNLSNRNLIINGAFQVAQRGTSSTSDGYQTVDRFRGDHGGTDEAPTYAQVDVASGTTPYTSGFRKAFKITNGNQTSGAGAADFIMLRYKAEAQDIANSGWNYTSSSSYITLSFWVKSSVAQNFYGYLETSDGSAYLYPFETGSLSADTWTKVTKTISGNSNLTFNNDNGQGLILVFNAFRGTDTTGSVSLNAWGAYNSSIRVPDMTSTWYTTNDATFEITGVQLEVGDFASDYCHEPYSETLQKCQRYYQVIAEGQDAIIGQAWTTSANFYCVIDLPVIMRATPSMEVSNWTDAFRAYGPSGGVNVSTLALNGETRNNRILINQTGQPGTGAVLRVYGANSGEYGKLAFTSEL